MKPFLSLLFLSLLSFASAESRLLITQQEKKVGYATVSQKLQADGVKVVELRMELGAGANKVKILSESRYDAKGNPIRKFQETTFGKEKKQVVVTFDESSAHVVSMTGDTRKIKEVPVVTATRASSSEFWFIRDTPKEGQIEKGYQFNVDSLEWELVTITYKGVKQIKVKGEETPVHVVVTDRGSGKVSTAYLGQDGLPVLIEQGDVKMVKL